MKDGKIPNPNTINPIEGYDKEIYIKPTIKNKNIIVGDFSYIADSDFERHVTHHYEWNNDKLIIGKFCQIASGVEFVMNGANHQMNSVSTFPFYTLEGWEQTPPTQNDLPIKGDTIIGNDVWIGQNATILPGVHIGDGVIIGTNSVVGSNIDPYTIVAGNFVDHRGANKILKKILKDNFNIEDISTHSLRHTFGTRCVEGGMRDVALQRLMGHGSVSATLDNYVSISESYTESELEKMYDYFMKNNIMTN